MSEDDKLKVYLCSDHFERLCEGNTCATCPSIAENRDVVTALAAMYADEPDKLHEAICTEIKSIRRSQQLQAEAVSKMAAAVHGNGKPGLVARVLVLETKDALSGSRNQSVYLAITGLIALLGLIVAMVN
jgi:hypothetical protein